MEHTKMPLKTCFLAVYLISLANAAMAGLALKRHLGVRYQATWLLYHNIYNAITRHRVMNRLGFAIHLTLTEAIVTTHLQILLALHLVRLHETGYKTGSTRISRGDDSQASSPGPAPCK
jgi:hypothetical protein